MIKSNPSLKSFFSDRVLLAAVVFGFALRSISLLTKGQFDVDQMIFWGESISSKGWARGYLGVYFPTSHLFFNAVVEFSSLFQLNSFTVFTILRFFSETIFLFCLIYLLISNYVSRKYFILLWLNPLLLVLILSGYTDTFSISLIFLFLTLCLKSFMSFRSQLSLFVFVITGFVLGFFAFLKPQTLLLTATVLFFICLTIILSKDKVLNFKSKVVIILGLTVPVISLFIFYSILVGFPNKPSCGEDSGPRTISNLLQSDQTQWDICLRKEDLGISYPVTGPGICLENGFSAFSPFGESGQCVKNYTYSSPQLVQNTISLRLFEQIVSGTSETMPSYSGNMPNIWYIYVLSFMDYDKSKGVWSYEASSNFNMKVLILVLMATFAYTILLFSKLNFRFEFQNALNLIVLFGLPITFFIPIFSTLAHENHFALGLVFTYLFLNTYRDSSPKLLRVLDYLIFISSSVQALHVARSYLWPMWASSEKSHVLNFLGQTLQDLIQIPTASQIAVITVICSVSILSGFPLIVKRTRK
jgi:hypothetical protein